MGSPSLRVMMGRRGPSSPAWGAGKSRRGGAVPAITAQDAEPLMKEVDYGEAGINESEKTGIRQS